jgi:type II secretory ATPase GspE/PulE/Tfp pilus assembly ATPase PilB-like protein
MALSDLIIRQLIHKSKLTSKKTLDEAWETSRHLGVPLTDVLIGRDIITDEALGTVLAKYYRVKFADLTRIHVPLNVLNMLPESFAIANTVIAFARSGATISIAMVNPKDLETIELTRKTIGNGTRIVPFVTTERGFREALRLYKKSVRSESESAIAPSTSAVPTVERLLDEAVRDEASDIHIEPLDTDLLVRIRIDGVLHDHITLPTSMHAPIVARVKILSDLKLDETRHPQDGQFSYSTRAGKKISLRVSTIPTVYGEKVVLRILHDALTNFQLEELGLLPEDLGSLEKVLRRTHGMILLTGPTGSGKTTTLYTMLGLLNKPGVNIITIEDPVENRIRRINQTQVNPLIHLTFANGLRSILRQDPDIIMVGEIRDNETAAIAVNAAMTGHLVFSSVHANTAAGAIPRMTDLGVEPFLLASTLHMVIAQRLVRVLCPKCKKSVPISPIARQWLDDVKARINPAIVKTVTANYESRGCAYCRRTGFKGRIGIFEIFDVDADIREAIVNKKSSDELWKMARAKHAKTMLEDGLIKVAKGITTIEEVFRVIST